MMPAVQSSTETTFPCRLRDTFDEAYYLSCYRESIPAGVSPLNHFLQTGLAQGWKPCATIDPLLLRLQSPALVIDGDTVLATPTGSVSAALSTITRDDRLRPPDAPFMRDRQDILQGMHLPATAMAHFNHAGQEYRIESPLPDEFFARFQREEPFAICRLSHGDWDCLAMYDRYRHRLAPFCSPYALTPQQIATLTARLCDEYHFDQEMFCEHFIPELQADLENPVKDPRFFHAIAFKGYPTFDDRLFVWQQSPDTVADENERLQLIARYFRPQDRLLDATCWKRWLITGALAQLAKVSRQRPVVLVGAERLDSLGQRWQAPWFHRVEIPASHGYSLRHDILDRCRATLQQAMAAADAQGLGKPLCLLQGSSFAYWLMRRLFQDFPDVFYLDLGQALHAWFYDNRDIPLMPWGMLYAPTIVRRCALQDYYARQGVSRPIVKSLFSGRIAPELMRVPDAAR